jgi:hypothetical protein
MADAPTLILGHNRDRAHRLIEAAPAGSVLTVKPAKRSLDQNAKLHAMATDLMLAKPQGRNYSVRVWKVMALAMIGKKVEFHPALDGDGVTPISPSTARLTKAECADMIEAMYAYGSEHGVQWSEPTLRHEGETA